MHGGWIEGDERSYEAAVVSAHFSPSVELRAPFRSSAPHPP